MLVVEALADALSEMLLVFTSSSVVTEEPIHMKVPLFDALEKPVTTKVYPAKALLAPLVMVPV